MATLIKKYANRRLYDPDESRYITLDELAEKIRGGAVVQVLDAKTNEDLTQPTLAQIILESRNAARLLPVPLLLQLVRMGDDALAEFFGRYVSSALELYQAAKNGAQSIAPWNPFATMPFAATNALARMLSGGSVWGEPPPPARAPEPPPSDVAALRRELDELKQSLRKERSPRKR